MRTRRGVCYPKVNASAMAICFEDSDGKKSIRKMKKSGAPVNGDKISISGEKNEGERERELSSRNSCFSSSRGACCDEYKDQIMPRRKRARTSPESTGIAGGGGGPDFFDALPDDLVVCILSKLSSSASCPADFINVLITYVLSLSPSPPEASIRN